MAELDTRIPLDDDNAQKIDDPQEQFVLQRRNINDNAEQTSASSWMDILKQYWDHFSPSPTLRPQIHTSAEPPSRTSSHTMSDASVTKPLIRDDGQDNDISVTNDTPVLVRLCKNARPEEPTDLIVDFLHEKEIDVNITDGDGFTPLHFACKNNHRLLVDHLLTAGARVDLTDPEGVSPLHIACSNNNHGIAELLLAKNAPVDLQDKSGATPLFLACERGYVLLVKMLISQGTKVIETPNALGMTPLIIASGNGHLDVVRVLLSQGAKLDSVTLLGESSLFCASDQGHLDVVDFLVSQGADIHQCTVSGGYTPLIAGSYLGHLAVVKLLLAHGAKIDKTCADGRTSLMVASDQGHSHVVEFLLSQGATVRKTNKYGDTCLHGASWRGHLEVVRLLLSWGAEVNRASSLRFTPLYLACEAGHHDVADFLLSKGAKVNKYSDRFTPLHIACHQGHRSVVELLLSRGAFIKKLTKCGRNVVDLACSEGRHDVGRLLLSRAPCPGFALCSAFRLACQYGYRDVVALLLNQGANIDQSLRYSGSDVLFDSCRIAEHELRELMIARGVNSVFSMTITPLSLAAFYGHRRLVDVLLDHYPKTNRMGYPVLYIAHIAGHQDVVDLLLSRGETSDTTFYDGLTAFHYACLAGDRDMVEMFLEKGANVNSLTSHRSTGLHLVCIHCGRKDVIELLVRRGANLDAIDSLGNTPLMRILYEEPYSDRFDLAIHLASLGATFPKEKTSLFPGCPKHKVAFLLNFYVTTLHRLLWMNHWDKTAHLKRFDVASWDGIFHLARQQFFNPMSSFMLSGGLRFLLETGRTPNVKSILETGEKEWKLYTVLETMLRLETPWTIQIIVLKKMITS